eukprot:TRINITY_DN17916_c0_g1_i1.p1 TRINITY_DN17916_c0_g1~~TRINITY_DN17916_c0_g1_i1.p1  ORF type:complete len:606 (+),score=151.62 TRINITY_DN17916_c0_g1_i1:51-1868(+)
MSNNRAALSVGIDSNCAPNLVSSINDLAGEGFDFCCLPLCHPRNRRNLLNKPNAATAWTRSDMLLNSQRWTSVVGKVSPWLRMDSEDAAIRTNSELTFWQEMQWAMHLSLPAVMLPAPAPPAANYMSLLNQLVLRARSLMLWVKIPLTSPEAAEQDEEVDTWQWWNSLRTQCEEHSNVGCVLEVTADLPSKQQLRRWAGEPVKALLVPTSIFMHSKKGNPMLSAAHQQFLLAMFQYDVQVVLTGQPHHSRGMTIYRQYLQQLYHQLPPLTDQQQYEQPYWDYLQAPLQPLADNLESQTYETFEKDPVKYKLYEEAIQAAVLDRVAWKRTLVVMVVGAGRGPLVRATLNVQKSTGQPLRVYAVEKNPNAVVTLCNMKESLGWTNVTIVDSDMRVWDAPEKADILVSELLGSFGDNELSPECLDGAQKFLADDGISIPYSYTSYLAPVSSERLHNEVKVHGSVANFETPYIVKLHNVYGIGEPQPCFTFVHPNRAEFRSNERYVRLEFTAPAATVIHGFAGYFQAMLYKEINMSINPATESQGMFSWFPIFLPLRNPVVVPAGSLVEVHLWRRCNKNKVWYEWTLTKPVDTPVHNPNGRSYCIGLFS